MKLWIQLAPVVMALLGAAALSLAAEVRGAEGARPAPQPLWSGDAPGALGKEPVDVPTLAVYPAPADKANGAAVVICPGGGYGVLADHEGHPVAVWLNGLGVTGAVLKYRLGPRYHHPAPLQDAARALRTLRARAGELKLDPHRIGILGFSAGGHLASTLSTHFDAGDANAADPVDRAGSRPDFSILVYPVISFTTEYTHTGSRTNLLGNSPTPELMELLSNEKQVTAQTPPTFLVHTAEDKGVPAENSLLYALALRKAGVPVEMHLYEKGPHGFGMAAGDPVLGTWPDRCAAWMRGRGLLNNQ
jgi:acetyl esterase/lipase